MGGREVKFRKTTAFTVAKDLKAFAKYLIADGPDEDDGLAELAAWLNAKLDELLSMDAFGTEGQNDPRGDHRR